jgi:diguanylate cyclase (GGDEF)-like protein
VLDAKSVAAVSESNVASFDHYGRLFRMLMPSLKGMVLYDRFGETLWASGDRDAEENADLVKDAIANAVADPSEFPGVVRIDDDRALYSFAVRSERMELLGVVALQTTLTGARSDARSLPYVRQILQPAFECLRRELGLRMQLGSSERDLGVRERDLSLMLDMSSNQTATGDADEFDLILKTALEHMGCALASLWVPDKNISMSMTRSGHPMSEESLQRAKQHLLAWIRLQQRTIIVNQTSKVAGAAAAPFKILACPVRHPSGRVMGVLALFNPASAQDFDSYRTRLAELLAKKVTAIIQAQYDASTGLLTRPAFESHAASLLASTGEPEQHCILYLDIDRLHVINETFGMHVGDDVIASVAECMARCVVPPALSARISGDRLAALIPNVGMAAATAIAENIRAAAAAILPRAGQGSFEVSASIGVAPVGRSGNALAHALATAEIACKAAKDRGRNRVEVFQDSDHSIIRRHTDILIVGTLRDALAHDSFRLDAQPILPLRGGYGRPGFELLIRMLGERGEVIPPSKFLSAAERYQLMPGIDRWVVTRACQLLSAHVARVGEDMARFAINLSGQSLQDEAFLPFVVDTIKNSRISPKVLCFELTETATVGNLERAQSFLRALQDLGCQFALDDFGTGVSSLSYLKDLSVNYLKIDGSFVRDSITNTRSESMIKAIAQLAKAMGMETVAEYVETDALRVRMADLGVDYGQGFAMGKHQPLEQLLEELAVFEATVKVGAPARLASNPTPVAALAS